MTMSSLKTTDYIEALTIISHKFIIIFYKTIIVLALLTLTIQNCIFDGVENDS